MDRLPEFLLNHVELTAAFLALTGLLAWLSFKPGGANRLTPVEATRLINDEDAVVVDVRVDGEFHDGHIVGSVNFPLEQIEASVKKLEKYRHRPVIAACRSGQRSTSAVKLLKGHGFERIYTLNGGITAWETANLPLAKGK